MQRWIESVNCNAVLCAGHEEMSLAAQKVVREMFGDGGDVMFEVNQRIFFPESSM